MRILTLCYEYPPLGGGGGKVAQGLANHLTRKGHEVDIITMGYKDLPKLDKSSGPTIMRLPGWRSKTESCHIGEMLPHELYAMVRSSSLIRSRGYDLVHAHFLFPDGFAARLLSAWFKLPMMVTAHGSDVPGYNPDRFKFQHKVLAPVWRYTVAGTDRIISPSEHLVTLIRKSAPDAPTEVIPNGFDPDRFRVDRPRELRILVVTRMFQRKGVQYVLKAAAGLKHPVEVHVVGEGPYLDELKQLDGELGLKARFWGWLDNDSRELRDLYETSSVFAFTSDQENFPVNLLEAMCAGNAIITTDSSGTREVVGEAAILVPPRDPDAIRSALEELVASRDLAASLGRKARARLEDNFSWDRVTACYEKSMQELVEAGRRSGGRAELRQ
jgi:glycosyltransferase involved in cell wall biosynthesis